MVIILMQQVASNVVINVTLALLENVLNVKLIFTSQGNNAYKHVLKDIRKLN
jgi:hypothetical protein